MISKIFRYIFSYLVFKPFIYKSNGRFTIIDPITLSCKNIELGNKVFIRNHGRIEGVTTYNQKIFNPRIIISDNVVIEQNLHLTCAKNIFIGKNTSIAANVSITDINHLYQDINLPVDKQNIEVGLVYIGENCKIYNNSVILPNVQLGKHTIIAANSVVMAGKYEDYILLAGSPAKIIKKYNLELKKWIKL